MHPEVYWRKPSNTVWSSIPRQEPTNKTTWEYQIGHRKSGGRSKAMWPHDGSNTGLGFAKVSTRTSTPDRGICSQDVAFTTWFLKSQCFFLALKFLHVFVNIRKNSVYLCKFVLYIIIYCSAICIIRSTTTYKTCSTVPSMYLYTFYITGKNTYIHT